MIDDKVHVEDDKNGKAQKLIQNVVDECASPDYEGPEGQRLRAKEKQVRMESRKK